MENKFQSLLGGRAQAVETTSLNQTKCNLNIFGLDTGSALLDQRSVS